MNYYMCEGEQERSPDGGYDSSQLETLRAHPFHKHSPTLAYCLHDINSRCPLSDAYFQTDLHGIQTRRVRVSEAGLSRQWGYTQ